MERRDLLKTVEKAHPCATMSWLVVMMVLAFMFDHPIWLLGLFLMVAVINETAGTLKQFFTYSVFGLPMIILVIITNVIGVQRGHTALATVENIPLIGTLKISLEALVYSAVMSLRLITVIGIFCLYNKLVNPDRLIKSVRGQQSHMLMATVLAIRLMPLLGKDIKRMMEVSRCRGVRFDGKGLVNRIMAVAPLVSLLLQSSLERSFTLAESMTSRGYGLPGRTQYRQELWQAYDGLLLGTATTAVMLGVAVKVMKLWQYDYYPVLTSVPWTNVMFWEILVMQLLIFMLPLIILPIFPRRWSS